MIALLAGIALAADPAVAPGCDAALTPPSQDLSVAWVSPLRDQVGRGGWLEVVRAGDLRRVVRERSGGSMARTLQLLGLRKRAKEPTRRWKVTIFDVRGADLCRPLEGYEEPAAVEGAVTCAPRLSRSTRTYEGCGWTTDLADGSPGLETFRIRWEDAARNGFCVLPADRYLAQALLEEPSR